MKVKFKKLHQDAVLPSYAKAGDAGLDIVAVSDGKFVDSEEGDKLFYYVEYDTGLAVEIPDNHVGLIFPRSSLSKTVLLLSNHVGVIDSGFRGEIKFRFKVDANILAYRNVNKDNAAVYKKGDRIGQLVIVPYPLVEPEFADELSDSERGDNGFGSTGQ